MQGDELAVGLFLWGTCFAFGLAAVTLVDSGRRILIRSLWGVSAFFLVAALLWPTLAERWPSLKISVENFTSARIALNVLGLAIFCLLLLDFGLRSGWLSERFNFASRFRREREIPPALLDRVFRIETAVRTIGDSIPDHIAAAAM